MIQKVLLSFSLTLISLSLFSQSAAEIQNRAVYNQLEFFFNTQQTDSIYALASPSFRDQTSLEDFKNALAYYYQFGRIEGAQAVVFSEGIVGYNIAFDNKQCHLQLAVDSNLRFTLLNVIDEPVLFKEEVSEPEAITIETNTLENLIQDIARSYIAGQDSASLSIGIIDDNKVSQYNFGTANPADSTEAEKETLYKIGSLSKLFTATLLAYLVEGDVISLDDTIATYLPDSLQANAQLQSISFKQLANHSSGLPKVPNNLEQSSNYNAEQPYANYTTTELYQFLKSAKLVSEPGEEYHYSEVGYALLADLISSITQKTYEANIQETIAIPLGLQRTFAAIDPSIPVEKPNKSKAKEVKQTVPAAGHSAMEGANGLHSTLQDLLRFAQYQFKMPENQLENALALTRLFSFYLPPNTDIGLGWNMNMFQDVIYYWHSSSYATGSSYIAIIPDLKSAVILLSDTAKPVEEASQQILENLLDH